jgi:hypothetical protein
MLLKKLFGVSARTLKAEADDYGSTRINFFC